MYRMSLSREILSYVFHRCVVAGTGILAIAHALSRSGWIGLLFLFTSAVMSHYTGVLLIRCLYAIP